MKRHETRRSSWCWGRVGIRPDRHHPREHLVLCAGRNERQSVRMMPWYVRASPDGAVSDGAAAHRCWIGELGPDC